MSTADVLVIVVASMIVAWLSVAVSKAFLLLLVLVFMLGVWLMDRTDRRTRR